MTHDVIWTNGELFSAVLPVLREAPVKPVRIIAVHVYGLSDVECHQQSLFETDGKSRDVEKAVDTIRDRWGEEALISGTVLQSTQKVLDRIAFGRSGLAK